MNNDGHSTWLSNLKIALVIFLLGITIYLNSFSNGFFADDYHQIIDNPAVHSLKKIPNFFLGSTFYTGTELLTGNYYKPLLTTIYSIMYAVFGANPTGFHVTQVLLHIINAFLIFLLFKSFLKKPIAFFLSLIFLSHPINTETVNYIANLQDVLFLFFGLLALVINNRFSFRLKSILVGSLLLASLLSKETGILFLLIVPLAAFIVRKKYLLKDSLMSIIVFTIYCLLRFAIAHVYFNKIITAPIMQLSLPERLMQVPSIIFFYLSTFIYPDNLGIFHSAVIKSTNINNFVLPLFADAVFFLFMIAAGIFIYRKSLPSFKSYLFFFVCFLAGLFFHLQIFPLDGTVADRWFYFPIIGLLGMLGVIAEMFIFNKKRNIQIIIFIAIFILIILSVRTIVRNTNWKDQITILSHDIKLDENSYQLEEGYGLELMKNGDLNEAYPHLLRSTQLFPGVNNLTSLGVYYGNTKQFDKAKTAFEKAMQYDDLALTYENYALLTLLTNDYVKTEEFTKKSVKKFPGSYKLWLYLALSSYALTHDKQALEAAQISQKLNPRPAGEYVLSSIKNGQRIDFSKI